VESRQKEVTEPVELDIQKIDAIFNSEYPKLLESSVYKWPVFFKSLPSRQLKYFKEGSIDNGRQVISLEEKK
jgi:hypothetical protein